MKKLIFLALAFYAVGWLYTWPKRHAKEMLASDQYLRSRVVQLKGSERGSCSGTQIRSKDGKDYILTAAHCEPLAKSGSIMTVDADGNNLFRKVLKEDPNSDLLLIEGLPNMKGIKVAEFSQAGQHIRTHTHGAGLPTWKSEGVIIDEHEITIPLHDDLKNCFQPKHSIFEMNFFGFEIRACAIKVFEMTTDAKVVPGSSGGLVADDMGALVGVVSAGDGNGFGYLVRTADINAFIP